MPSADVARIAIVHSDAVLLDLQMPLGNGVAHEIRELKAELHFKPLWPQDLVAITRLLHRA